MDGHLVLIRCLICLLHFDEFSKQHTAENMGNELKIIICEWNKHGKIVAVASDNAENIVAAIKLLKI